MGNNKIEAKYRDGMFWVRINGGEEFPVDEGRWNDPELRASIIAAETGPELQPWMGEIG